MRHVRLSAKRGDVVELRAAVFDLGAIGRAPLLVAAGGTLVGCDDGAAVNPKLFEDLLSALFRAGFIHLEEESFESEGRTIEFRRPVITPAGRRADADEIAALRVPSRAEARKSKRAARRKKTSRSKKKTGSKRKRSARKKLDLAVTASPRLLESLRAFRLKEARIRNIPAFRIFSDRVMAAIANERPQMAADLLAINGVGATLHKRYGERILQIVAEN